MNKRLRIAIAQINATVGDIDGNAAKIIEYANRARRQGADIVTFPELALCGYPPEDLLHKPAFISENLRQIRKTAGGICGITAIVGFVDRQKDCIYNAAAVINDGRIRGIYHKTHLPNYSVFDEKRYFKEGTKPFVFKIKGITCGINICEDIWHLEGPLSLQAKKGARIFFVINASPYFMGKIREREEILRRQAVRNRVFISYTNLVGGQDELVFDGQSFIMDTKGRVVKRAEAFKEDLLVLDVCEKGDCFVPTSKMSGLAMTDEKKPLEPLDEVYEALVLGLRDYIHKNGFRKVVIGLSGGIDSALTAVIAKEALGKENVIGVFMPSMFTSNESKADTLRLVENLGIRLYTISINSVFEAYIKDLNRIFKGLPKDITEENLQARIRGNILMAISNKYGYIVLATGNKSEISCGYCTLYGDMAGGFSVIKDVPKTLVYKLARFINREREIIPRHTITRPPTAELRSGQRDVDTLPPYEVMDPIIKEYVELDKSLEEIVRRRDKKSEVLKVVRMIDRNEYKRRQASPGIKITPKAFGKDRRMPITNRFMEKSVGENK